MECLFDLLTVVESSNPPTSELRIFICDCAVLWENGGVSAFESHTNLTRVNQRPFSLHAVQYCRAASLLPVVLFFLLAEAMLEFCFRLSALRAMYPDRWKKKVI